MVQPIMLNRLFHNGVGFRKGVRASAALNFGILALAVVCMKTKRAPHPTQPSGKKHLGLVQAFGFMREPLYAMTVIG